MSIYPFNLPSNSILYAGYDHMHSHFDRDKYITINWGNIDHRVRDNFEKVDPMKFDSFNTTYDYKSLMHYGPTAFSENGRRTIIPKDSRFRDIIGQREAMSEGDKQRINNMYKCNVTAITTTKFTTRSPIRRDEED